MKQTITLNEHELHNLISESVRRVLNEYGEEYYNNGGVNAGYSGYNSLNGYTGYVSQDEGVMRDKFNKLKRYGKIAYDYFDDWKAAGYPHADEV